MAVLWEGSGSNRHEVQKVTQTENGTLQVEIEQILPGPNVDATCDIAHWHIMVEVKLKNTEAGELTAEILLVDNHKHALAKQPQTVDDPVSGYCGNIQTTLYLDHEPFTFWGGQSVTLTDILINLAYNQASVCKCPAEYRADTEFGSGYEINLSQGFVRCEKGQCSLTQEQLTEIHKVIQWAKTQDTTILP